MIIEQAAEKAGFELIGNAPPAKQRGARYWQAFIAELRRSTGQLQQKLQQAYKQAALATQEAVELRQQLAELRTTPLEMLICRARQGREPLEQTYRQLCLRLHPDRGGSTTAFQQLQADYEAAQTLLPERSGQQ